MAVFGLRSMQLPVCWFWYRVTEIRLFTFLRWDLYKWLSRVRQYCLRAKFSISRASVTGLLGLVWILYLKWFKSLFDGLVGFN